MSDALKPLIALAADRPLTQSEAFAAFEVLFSGSSTPSQIGGLLMAMRTRGETVAAIPRAPHALRTSLLPVRPPAAAP